VTGESRPSAYARAGVDIDAAERLVGRFAEIARSTRRPEVLADVGPFAGLFRLAGFRDPVLAAATDSVGTKVKLASLLGRFEAAGHDIVNHCVNDVLTTGAHPLFFLDYIGNFGLSDEDKAAIVKGCADACREVGCALLGGETADMPGTYAEGDFDLAGFVLGAVERELLIDGSRIKEGDALIGLPSNGLHTNGYSLVRKIFEIGIDLEPDEERAVLQTVYPELGETLADALLRPHRCYYNEVKGLLDGRLKGIAHITGGGIPGNVPRILPQGRGARIDRSAWQAPPVFALVKSRGDVPDDDMYRTFNMGLGFVLVVAPEDAGAVLREVPEAFACGEVVAGEGVVWAE
jgi:phosphoribosylformylglycinamidine cyclo-ligase